MVMDTLQIRLEQKVIKKIDIFVRKGIYSSRADAIRDAARKLFMQDEVNKLLGTMPYRGDSVQLVRQARKEFSRKRLDPKEINNY